MRREDTHNLNKISKEASLQETRTSILTEMADFFFTEEKKSVYIKESVNILNIIEIVKDDKYINEFNNTESYYEKQLKNLFCDLENSIDLFICRKANISEIYKIVILIIHEISQNKKKQELGDSVLGEINQIFLYALDDIFCKDKLKISPIYYDIYSIYSEVLSRYKINVENQHITFDIKPYMNILLRETEKYLKEKDKNSTIDFSL